MNDTGFKVRLLDGPAAGWEYMTGIHPPQKITVMPAPPSSAFSWIRVEPMPQSPWPGEQHYELSDHEVDDEDVVLLYKHVGGMED